MKMRIPTIGMFILLVLFVGILPVVAMPGAAVANLPVYTDSLASGWQDWPYNSATINYANTGPSHSGTVSIAVTYTEGWDGLQFGYHGANLNISAYDTFRFWIHGGTTGGQTIQIQLGSITQNIIPQANTWTKVDVSLLPLGSPRSVYSITWFNNTGGSQATFYLDDIAFVDSGAPTPTPPSPGTGPALSVDAGADQHSISPYIYGMNYATEAIAADLNLPVRRWGGNSTSRYNWENGFTNTGSDWYYENIPGNSADDFVNQDRRTGTKTILTMPLIGWVSKNSPSSHPFACGFKISKYGNQEDADWSWDADCGNGNNTSGTPITGNDPLDTSIAITSSYATSWVNHLTSTFGAAANGGVMFYNLDNEPMLWNSTHRDVHPNPTTYDELRDKTWAYAAAIKAADPTAKTLGPVVWGWCAYFYSAADGCSPGSDHQAHNNTDFVEWYLQQMRNYEQQHGVRLLDYVDVHIYPQIDGLYSESLGSAETQSARLRSTRQLWDTTYVHEGWIGQPVYLIPRMKQWVASDYPGTKLAITEYNWGALGYMNGALAQADLLGIFGREGLDLATLWGPPDDANAPGIFAFRMYRNYDGQGSTFGETSIHTVSADQEKLSIYAARRSQDGALTVMVINKAGTVLTSSVTLANFPPAALAQVYSYSNANLNAIVHKPDQPVTSGGFSADFPANSITLFIIPASTNTNSISCALFPANNIWNTRIDTLPVNVRSAQWVTNIGRTTGFHMDFGSGTWDDGPIGIPFNTVNNSTPGASVSFDYSDESDPGPYPIPANPLIEYGSDHHILMVNNDNCHLYELYDASYSGGVWHAGSGAIWDLGSNALRPNTWTSADAAGLPILPGLVRYDEIVSGQINHAIRFTASQTNGYIWPARHLTSNDPNAPQIPPMGARFRLKSSYNIAGFPSEIQVILRAMKQYGIILADNGSNWYVSGAPDERWNNDHLHLLDVLTGNDFEAVDSSGLMVNVDSGAAKGFVNAPPTVNSFTATSPSTSRNIPITAFTASDDVSVTGYKITTSSTAPVAGDAGWTVSAPTTYTVSADGNYTLYPWAKDAEGVVSAAFGFPASVIVDSTAPTVTSITRANPNPTASASVNFTVTFSEAVQGVGTTDFALTTTGMRSASITAVSGSGATRTVTVNTGGGSGTIRLDVPVTATINDLVGNSINGLPFTTGEVYTVMGTTALCAPVTDYNGDGKTDIAVFRPSTNTWWIKGQGSFVYGQSGDTPVPADYNGDCKTDIAVFRPSTNTWWIKDQGSFIYGTVGDIPVPADYDGDGKADIAVFRPSTNTWWIKGQGAFVYGTVGDTPVVADYNGDGKADIAVFRPSTNTWWIKGQGATLYGTVGDIPVIADYNGDGKSDIAVFRPSTNTWWIKGQGATLYGTVDDIPVIGDYNGDGKADITIFRPSTNTWWIKGQGATIYGTVGDIPV